MTPQEYNLQNAKGYEGDDFIHDELKKLCEKFKVKTIIETGTYHGGSTKRLATLADKVFTIETKKENFDYSRNALLGTSNVHCILGNSSIMLPGLLTGLSGEESYCFFLDAHWESHNPLLDELKAIADKGLKPVIFIHDFKNPAHPEFGFDSYGGQDYDFAWIKAGVERIYGADGYDYHYNSIASGAKRGVIYIYPKAAEVIDGKLFTTLTETWIRMNAKEEDAEWITDNVYLTPAGYLHFHKDKTTLSRKGKIIVENVQYVHQLFEARDIPDAAPVEKKVHISIIHPSRGRAAQAMSTYMKWMSEKSGELNVEYILSYDTDEPQLKAYDDIIIETLAIACINDNSCIVDAVNRAAAISKGKVLIVISDDISCLKNWDDTIYNIFKDLHKEERNLVEGVVLKTFDGQEQWIVTVPIVDRAWYEREGCIYQPGYTHMFCDTDLTHKAELLGCLVFRNDILFKQDHTKKDAGNIRADNTWNQGQEFYFQRIKQKFGLPADTNVWKLGDHAKAHINWCLERMYK